MFRWMLDQIQSPDLTLRLVIEDGASLPFSHRYAKEIAGGPEQIPAHKSERGSVADFHALRRRSSLAMHRAVPQPAYRSL